MQLYQVRTVLQDMVCISGSTLMQAAKHLDFNSDDIFNKKRTFLQYMVGLSGTTLIQAANFIYTKTVTVMISLTNREMFYNTW